MKSENLIAKEICELLKIWFYIKQLGVVWDDALRAIELRIDDLSAELNKK